LLACVALIYLPGLGGGFIFDDYPNIVLNSKLHLTSWNLADVIAAATSSPAADLPRPLAMLSFAINHLFTGLDPRPMKVTNVVVHLRNTLVAIGLARSVFLAAHSDMPERGGSLLGFTTAAWWAVLPINVTSVLFIVQRMESLSHTFVLLGLWLYVYGRQKEVLSGERTLAFPLMLVATGIGLTVKESASLTPLYALVAELTIFGFRRGTRRDPVLLFALVGLIVAGGVLALLWLLPRSLDPQTFAHRPFTLAQRLMTEPRVLASYIRWTLAPSPLDLGFFHDDFPISKGILAPITTLPSILLVGGMFAMAWILRKRRPVLALALGWNVCSHLLTATFIPLELAFEHRNYFASFALCLGLAELAGMLLNTTAKRLTNVAVAALFVFYSSTSLMRTIDWASPLGFVKLEAAKHPGSPRATYSLAQAYAALSRYDASSVYYSQAVSAFQSARRVPHAGLLPAQGLLILQARSGQPLDPQLWNDISRELSEQPVGPQEVSAVASMTICAVDKTCSFPPDRMLDMYAAAMSQGEQAEVLNLFANYSLNVLGNPGLAITGWTRASELRPNEAQYVISLAKINAATGRPDEARVWISKLRSMGRFGQYLPEAKRLESNLGDSR
jgi:hypothetical protein